MVALHDVRVVLALAIISVSGSSSAFIIASSPSQSASGIPKYAADCVGRELLLTRTSSHSMTTRLRAIMDTPRIPAEGEERRESGSKDDLDWTPIEGGFLPNIVRRRRRPTNVFRIETIREYKNIVVDERDRIVVVRFYASWCRSCKAMEPAFNRLVTTFSPEVKFVQVPLTRDNAHLYEGLGVPSVPFSHIYHPDVGLVEERKSSNKHMPQFTRVLKSYVIGSCDLPTTDDDRGLVVVDGGEENEFQ